MVGQQLKSRPASAKAVQARCISPTYAIPTATNCARFIACRLHERPQVEMKRAAHDGGPCILIDAARGERVGTETSPPTRCNTDAEAGFGLPRLLDCRKNPMTTARAD